MTDKPTPEWVVDQLCKLAIDVDIDSIVESGKLVRRSAGWYEVKDISVIQELGQSITALGSGNPPKIRIPRSAGKRARGTLKRVRIDLLRDAVSRCERAGNKRAAALCREILRERGVADS